MAPKGRKRKARALTDVDVSASSASQRRAVEWHGAPAAAVGDRNSQTKGEEEFGKSWTPYGTLMKKLPLDIIDSARTVMLEYICPFAFLWLASQESTGFASFLALYFGALGVGEAAPAPSVLDESKTARIGIYVDDSRPGNNLRPDKGRKYYAYYWTFLELPDWFRASQVGWFPLCFVLVESVEKIAGGLSRITALLLEAMFSDAAMAFSFSTTGMRLPIGVPTAAYLWIRATFACFLADEKAFKELSCAKGASGVKMCICCQNVVGSARFQPDRMPMGTRLVHYLTAPIEACRAHTRDSILSIAEFLSEKGTQVPPPCRLQGDPD